MTAAEQDNDRDTVAARYLRHQGPMHGWFQLSYASYLVLPRAFIQEMPVEWQERMVALLREMAELIDEEDGESYMVSVKDRKGRFCTGKWGDYRHGPFPRLRASGEKAE